MTRLLRMAALCAVGALALGAASAFAQINPPSTMFGSVADESGPIAEGLKVEAYVNGKLCGTGATQFSGDGDARVTVWYVDVQSTEDRPGCGAEGVDVEIKIGDRTAPQVPKWRQGPVRLDITFGNVQPAPIPTFTPTPTKTPSPQQTPQPGASAGAGSVGTIPAGSPGAGSPVPTLKGGVTSATPQSGGAGEDEDGGGFPVWAVAILVLGGIAAVGGGVGFAMSRSRDDASDDDYPPPPLD